MNKDEALGDLALQIRRDSIRMIRHAGSGHLGGAMGAAELFALLYGEVLKHRPEEPDWKERDRVILSNGHICAAWYSVLARTGYLPLEELATHRRINSRLQGHPSRSKLPLLVDNSSGPLGQGPSVANGIALSARMDGRTSRVYSIVGDGEIAEGQAWEAFMSAGHFRLSNLTMIVLANGLQIDGEVEKVRGLEPLTDKLASFRWEVQEVNGHDVTSLRAAFQKASSAEKPTAVVARVAMAKGYAPWENDAKWHGSCPSEEEATAALAALGMAKTYEDFPLNERRAS